MAHPPTPVDDATTRFRRLFDHAPFGVHVYRLDDAARLVFSAANPAADRLLGIAHETLVGLPIEEAFPGLAGSEVPARYREVAERGTWQAEHIRYEDRRVRGAYDVHAFQLAQGEMAAVFHDVTQRRAAEDALRESEEKYRLLVSLQQDLIVKVDLEGRLVFASPSYYRYFGTTEEALRDQPMWPRIHPEDRTVMEAGFVRACEPPYVGEVEHRALTPRGERRLSWVGAAVFDASGAVVGFVATGRDVTEQREMEERLRQSEKMQAIGRLAGGVAHDFNNQLVGILSAAELLRESAGDADARLLADTIVQAARRSAELTRQLLAFARKGKMATLPVDVGGVVREVVALLRHGVDKRIALDVQVPPEPVVVLGDAAQLHHAVLNLALNACDAMVGGGTLTLSARPLAAAERERERERVPQEVPAGPVVEVVVRDTGPGVDPAARPHLFEPFFTTKDPGKGSGLGLAAVYGTVKGHRGTISVASEPGRGTAFTVWLPAAAGAPAVGARASPPPQAPRRRVLIVDDEALVRSSLSRVLARDGHEVLTAESGRAALDVHARERGRIDVVVLDMMMPDLSGPEVFRLLRAAEPGLRVVLSSGYSVEGEAQALVEAGRVSVLQKPYTVEEVRRVFAAAFGADR